MPDSYLVCATPRTGSSLLLGLLDSTGVGGHPQSYFRSPDEESWARRWGLREGYDYREFVAAARVAGTTPNGIFGAKVMWGTHAELLTRLGPGDDLALLREVFGDVRFVHVFREDVLAQAVSWARAEQTGRWYLGGRGEISGGPAGDQGEPVFDAERISELIATIEEHNEGWNSFFAKNRINPVSVRYEDLDADMTATTERVLSFLGVEAESPLTAFHQRQADRLNSDWIQRYQAASIAGS
ncbi:Stf0 family sulfotransferase [Actinoplanes sp. NPDC051861]|uniref:Stf0 family sulfotransferase n=1 Tax=Actinoplanes sp. NPDC051861 TaxID=3155170 RepID=UPI003430DFFE